MHWKCPRCAWVNDTQEAYRLKTCFKCGYHDGHQPFAATPEEPSDAGSVLGDLAVAAVESLIDSSPAASPDPISTTDTPAYDGGGGDFSGGGSSGDF